MQKPIKVSLIGTGLLGKAVAEKLAKSVDQVTVYNRTRPKAESLAGLGVTIADSPSQAIAASECTLLFLTDSAATDEVLFNSAHKVNLQGKSIIQMGTISPAESIALESKISQSGGNYFECPVLGSIPEAKEGKLILMVGATEEQFETWRDFLKILGPNPLYIGKVGQAAALKLALNQLIASLTTAFALSLGFVLNNNIDVEMFMNILRESALYAPTFDKKLSRMLDRSFLNPNFPTTHLLKDINLFAKEAKKLNMNTDMLEGIKKVITETIEKGFAETDYSSLYEAINPKR